MMVDRQIHDPALRLRIGWAETLCCNLAECDPAEAAPICVAYLDDMAAGMPTLNPFGDLRADAEWWADFAHPAELEAYFAAALRRLGNRALGKESRKRLFKHLWLGMPAADRAAFLAHVQGGR